MPVDPSDHRPVTSDMRVSNDLRERLHTEYSYTMGKMNALVEELSNNELYIAEFVALHRAAWRTLHERLDYILSMSVGGRTYAPQRLSPDEQAFDTPPDQ